MGTASGFRASADAVRLGKASAIAAVEDFFDTFAANLESFRVDTNADPYDDAVATSLEEFRPYRDEALDLVVIISRYRSDREMYDVVHRWLERLLLYKFPPSTMTSWREEHFDNFKFVLNELFLCIIAVLLKARRYEQARWLMENKYFIPVIAGRPEAKM